MQVSSKCQPQLEAAVSADKNPVMEPLSSGLFLVAPVRRAN